MLAFTGAPNTTETTSVVAVCSRLCVLYHSEPSNLQNSVYLLLLGIGWGAT